MSEKPTYKKGLNNALYYKACQENMLKGEIKNLLPSVPKGVKDTLNHFGLTQGVIENRLDDVSNCVDTFCQNFDDMNETSLKGGDKYFHCKANYESTSQGLLPHYVGKGLSLIKEVKDVFEHGPLDCLEDWQANKDGWTGAKEGKTLLESCGHYRPRTLPEKY